MSKMFQIFIRKRINSCISPNKSGAVKNTFCIVVKHFKMIKLSLNV